MPWSRLRRCLRQPCSKIPNRFSDDRHTRRHGEKIFDLRRFRMVRRNPLDGALLLSGGGRRTDCKNIPLDVSHLWTGGSGGTSIPDAPAVLSAVAEMRRVHAGDIYHRISDGRTSAADNRGMSMGLRQWSTFCVGADTAGLCAALGDAGVVF